LKLSSRFDGSVGDAVEYEPILASGTRLTKSGSVVDSDNYKYRQIDKCKEPTYSFK